MMAWQMGSGVKFHLLTVIKLSGIFKPSKKTKRAFKGPLKTINVERAYI